MNKKTPKTDRRVTPYPRRQVTQSQSASTHPQDFQHQYQYQMMHYNAQQIQQNRNTHNQPRLGGMPVFQSDRMYSGNDLNAHLPHLAAHQLVTPSPRPPRSMGPGPQNPPLRMFTQNPTPSPPPRHIQDNPARPLQTSPSHYNSPTNTQAGPSSDRSSNRGPTRDKKSSRSKK